MAYAGHKFANAVLSGLAGIKTIECAYVAADPDARATLPYFSSRVTFGAKGVEIVHPVGPINEYEKGRLKEAISQLQEEIDAGLKYAAGEDLVM